MLSISAQPCRGSKAGQKHERRLPRFPPRLVQPACSRVLRGCEPERTCCVKRQRNQRVCSAAPCGPRCRPPAQRRRRGRRPAAPPAPAQVAHVAGFSQPAASAARARIGDPAGPEQARGAAWLCRRQAHAGPLWKQRSEWAVGRTNMQPEILQLTSKARPALPSVSMGLRHCSASAATSASAVCRSKLHPSRSSSSSSSSLSVACCAVAAAAAACCAAVGLLALRASSAGPQQLGAVAQEERRPTRKHATGHFNLLLGGQPTALPLSDSPPRRRTSSAISSAAVM